MSARVYCLVMLVLSFAVAGCTEATNSPASISVESATPAVFNSTGAPTVEFSLPDMMCEDGCAMTVKDVLSKQSGAKDVVVDFDGKTATVAIEEGQFDADQAIAALVDKGFDNSKLKTEPPETPVTEAVHIEATPTPSNAESHPDSTGTNG